MDRTTAPGAGADEAARRSLARPDDAMPAQVARTVTSIQRGAEFFRKQSIQSAADLDQPLVHGHGSPMDYASVVQAIISGDPIRWRILDLVRSMRLPDCWVGAGFVRNAVWSHLHGHDACSLASDVDVLWFDPERVAPAEDRKFEALLRTGDASVAWSVKNQARMHVRNGDPPYTSTSDAMRHWTETATAIAVRRNDQDYCDVSAPFGFDDLFGLVLRPTPRCVAGKRAVFDDRIRTKDWLTTWPLLRVEPGADGDASQFGGGQRRTWPDERTPGGCP
jgi:hypothetical protein